jgi:hypothetical protein
VDVDQLEPQAIDLEQDAEKRPLVGQQPAEQRFLVEHLGGERGKCLEQRRAETPTHANLVPALELRIAHGRVSLPGRHE